MTGNQRPELSVFVQGLLANAPHVVTVLTCAAAFDEGRLAEVNTVPNNTKHAAKQNALIHVSCATGFVDPSDVVDRAASRDPSTAAKPTPPAHPSRLRRSALSMSA